MTRLSQYIGEFQPEDHTKGLSGCGLIKAAALIEDGRIDAFVEEKYASFKEGIGAKIVSGDTTLEELAAYAIDMGAPQLPMSGRQEYLQSIVNQVMFK